ncbi:MAG TPA: hypothetical protein VH796_03640 [Nitrososphaeraceae archaeon]
MTSYIRGVWNGKNLTLDNSLQPMKATQPGQTSLLAPMIAGNWVFDFTNGYLPANVPISALAVSQANSSKMARINPIPLAPGQQIYIPNLYEALIYELLYHVL